MSATVLAIGPAVLSWSSTSENGQAGTRPGLGRRPTTLQKPAGLRSDPPRSLPSARQTIRAASAAAAPPLLPPAVRSSAHGLRVAPNTGLTVCEPEPHSGTFVLPRLIAPAAAIRWTTSASRAGTLSANSGEPNVVRTPAVSARSLCATGRPCSSPVTRPCASSSSAAAACAVARSKVRVTTALTTASCRSIRSMCAAMTSRADTSRRRSIPASSIAVCRHRSVT